MLPRFRTPAGAGGVVEVACGLLGPTTPPGPRPAGELFWKLVWNAGAADPGFWSQLVEGGRWWSGSLDDFEPSEELEAPTPTATCFARPCAALVRPSRRPLRSRGLDDLAPGGWYGAGFSPTCSYPLTMPKMLAMVRA